MNSAAVILVETSESLNVGSVSRAMMNFGFSDLRLVSPERYQPEKAEITACGARGPLDSLQIFDSPEKAMADRDLVVGFSARSGKTRGQILSLSDWIVSSEFRSSRRLGLLFGPEDNGLRQEHMEKCSSLVYIPTDSAYPSMNLAQAVAVTLFSIAGQTDGRDLLSNRIDWAEFEQLDKLVSGVARLSGFFNKGTPQPVPSVLKSLFRQLNLTHREMAILLGLFGTTLKALEGKVPLQIGGTTGKQDI